MSIFQQMIKPKPSLVRVMTAHGYRVIVGGHFRMIFYREEVGKSWSQAFLDPQHKFTNNQIHDLHQLAENDEDIYFMARHLTKTGQLKSGKAIQIEDALDSKDRQIADLQSQMRALADLVDPGGKISSTKAPEPKIVPKVIEPSEVPPSPAGSVMDDLEADIKAMEDVTSSILNPPAPEPVKKKRGWPKGKKRKPLPSAS